MDERLKGVIANQGARGTEPWLVRAVNRPLVVSSIANSSNVPLAANGVFTGAFEPVDLYPTVIVHVISDQSSNVFVATVSPSTAGPGVQVQWSNDQVSVLSSDHFDFAAENGGASTAALGSGRAVVLPVKAPFLRVIYTNSSVAQGTFSLRTYFSLQPLGNRGLESTEALLYGCLRAVYQGAQSMSAAGTATLLQAIVGRNAVLWGGIITLSVTGTVLITNVDAAAYNLAANTPMYLSGLPGSPYGIVAANTAIQVTTTGTSQVFRMRYNYSYF